MVTDKMVLTKRESDSWATNPMRTWMEQVGQKHEADGSITPIMQQRSELFRDAQTRVLQEYADRTGHQVTLWLTDASGDETHVLTAEPTST